MSGCSIALCFGLEWWHMAFAVQDVSGCYVSLHFETADDTFLWLFRQWVAALPCYILSQLTMPVPGSAVSEWRLCLIVLWVYWCLFMTLQPVSSCHALPHLNLLITPVLYSSESQWLNTFPSFKFADDTCPLLFRKWVTAISLCLQACWQCLYLAL